MKIYQVDAFTDKAFGGNPAAVVLLEKEVDKEWMQSLAEENNLAETAYLLKEKDGYNLRWFTPRFEVDLCGHATLASSHILWETGLISKDEEAVFNTLSGQLRAIYKDGFIELNFPEELAESCELPDTIIKSLGVDFQYTGKNRMDYLIEVASAEVLHNLDPDYKQMMKANTRGVIVTCRSDVPEYDFLSRFFAPFHGIDEDPVTGSAHCCTGPYWRDMLGLEELRAYQASPRGGKVNIAFNQGRVLLKGKAITVMEGKLRNV